MVRGEPNSRLWLPAYQNGVVAVRVANKLYWRRNGLDEGIDQRNDAPFIRSRRRDLTRARGSSACRNDYRSSQRLAGECQISEHAQERTEMLGLQVLRPGKVVDRKRDLP